MSALRVARSYARILTRNPVRNVRTWRGLARWFRRPLRVVAHGLERGEPRLVTSTMRDGHDVSYRAGTADTKVVREMFVEDEYRLDAMPEGQLGVVVDVGAHIGLFSLRVAPRADRVLAFEPHPENFALLERNLSGAAFAQVERKNVAVAASAGTTRLWLGGRNTAGHTTAPAAGPAAEGAIDVPCVSLADELTASGVASIDLLKLDCEGAEYAIVESLVPWGLGRVARAAIEYHAAPAGAPASQSGEALEATLAAAGFRVDRLPSADAGYGLLFATRAAS